MLHICALRALVGLFPKGSLQNPYRSCRQASALGATSAHFGRDPIQKPSKAVNHMISWPRTALEPSQYFYQDLSSFFSRPVKTFANGPTRRHGPASFFIKTYWPVFLEDIILYPGFNSSTVPVLRHPAGYKFPNIHE